MQKKIMRKLNKKNQLVLVFRKMLRQTDLYINKGIKERKDGHKLLYLFV